MNDVPTGPPAITEATAIGFYLVYALVAVTLVAFLARTLSRNGQIFLEETFERPELAAAVNHLLAIGFYLLNLGYALLVYRLGPARGTVIEAFSELVVKLGVLLVSLGVIHLVNMSVFWRIRTSANRPRKALTPPSPPPYAPMPMSMPMPMPMMPGPAIDGIPG